MQTLLDGGLIINKHKPIILILHAKVLNMRGLYVIPGSLEIQHVECRDVIEIYDGIIFVFYPGMPHTYQVSLQLLSQLK